MTDAMKTKLEELFAKSATEKLLNNIEFVHAERYAQSIGYCMNSVQWHTPNSLCFDELYKRIEAEPDSTLIVEGKTAHVNESNKVIITNDKNSDLLLIAKRTEGKESNNPVIQVVLL